MRRKSSKRSSRRGYKTKIKRKKRRSTTISKYGSSRGGIRL